MIDPFLVLCGGAIAVNLLRGRSRIDCDCSAGPQWLSPWMLLRNGLPARDGARRDWERAEG